MTFATKVGLVIGQRGTDNTAIFADVDVMSVTARTVAAYALRFKLGTDLDHGGRSQGWKGTEAFVRRLVNPTDRHKANMLSTYVCFPDSLETIDDKATHVVNMSPLIPVISSKWSCSSKEVIANARTSNLAHSNQQHGKHIRAKYRIDKCRRNIQEKSLLTDVLPSWFFLRTFATANSKSSCVTCCLRSRRAYMPMFQISTGADSRGAVKTYQLLCICLVPQHQNIGPSSPRVHGG
jgi:hypothetical protein